MSRINLFFILIILLAGLALAETSVNTNSIETSNLNSSNSFININSVANFTGNSIREVNNLFFSSAAFIVQESDGKDIVFQLDNSSGVRKNFMTLDNSALSVVFGKPINLKGNNLTSSSTGNVSVGQDLKVYGDVWAQGADVAEIYASPQKLEAGEIVAINTEKDDSVVKTTERFQENVAGIVSTNPGQVLNWNERGYPIALAGKVPVKLSDSDETIKRGERIVPSEESGRASNCSIWDPIERKDKTIREIVAHNEDCRSSTIGRALENSNGKSKILVKIE